MALFQSGQTKAPWPAQGKFNIDNGTPQVTYLPVVSGTFVANGTSQVSILSSAVTASSQLFMTMKTNAGTPAVTPPAVQGAVVGTGFAVVAAAGDTSTYNYVIIG